jgi:hypothetical protein
MADLRDIIVDLMRVMRSNASLTETMVAETLNLDITQATSTQAKNVTAITGALMKSPSSKVGLVFGLSEPKSIHLILENKVPIDGLSKEALLGSTPRIEDSRTGKGYAVIFDYEDLSAGVTVSGADDTIETFFCDARDGCENLMHLARR